MEYSSRLPALSLDALLWGLQGLSWASLGICLLLMVGRGRAPARGPCVWGAGDCCILEPGCLPSLGRTQRRGDGLGRGKDWMKINVLVERCSFSGAVVFSSN